MSIDRAFSSQKTLQLSSIRAAFPEVRPRVQERIIAYTNHVFYSMASFTKRHAYVGLTAVGIIGLGAVAIQAVAALVAKKQARLDEERASIDKLLEDCRTLKNTYRWEEIRQRIKTFSKCFIASFSKAACNKINIQVLAERLGKIVLGEAFDLTDDEERAIVMNIAHDFRDAINEAKERISIDVKAGDLHDFGIDPGTALTYIQCLGSETHNHGRVPMLLRFRNGRTVVYKPRSMHPEALLYRRNGVMETLGLRHYTVVNKGTHGYSQYLLNEQTGNTIRTIAELQAYYDRLRCLHIVATKLKMTDLHLENIIVADLIPFIIDAECFYDLRRPSGIFGYLGGGEQFFRPGQDIPAGNKVWISRAVVAERMQGRPDHKIDRMTARLERDIRAGYLRGLGIQRIGVYEFDDSTYRGDRAAMEAQIRALGRELRRERCRFIVLDTGVFLSHLRIKSPFDDAATLEIKDAIVAKLMGEFRFTMVRGSLQVLIDGLRDDFAHQDVPIFYYDLVGHTVIYRGVVIAERMLSQVL